MQAFEKYYSDNVVITEPSVTIEGKNACREHKVQFMNFIAEYPTEYQLYTRSEYGEFLNLIH